MLFSTSSFAALALVATSGLINAQGTPSIPDCAKTCVNNLITGLNCNNDPTCICSNSAFIQQITCCILPVCSSTEVQNALAFANGICGLVGVTLPQNAVCSSSASGSTTASSTVSITSATGSGVTAVGGTAASSLTGAAASSMSSLESSASAILSSAVSASSLSSGATGAIASLTSAVASVSSAAASAASSVVPKSGAGGIVTEARASWSMAVTGVVVAIAIGALGVAL